MRLGDKIAINALSQLAVQVVSVALSIAGLAVTTRYLTVTQFGEIQAAFALVTTFQFMSDLGLSTIGARTLARGVESESDETIKALFTGSFFFTILLIAVAVSVAFGAYHGSRELARQAALVLLIPFLFTPWLTVGTAHAVWKQQLWKSSIINLVSKLSSVAGLFIAAEYRLGPLLVAVAYMLGYGVSAVGIVWWKREILPVFALRLNPRVRGLVAAGLSLSIITVVNAIYLRLDAFLLSILSTPRSVALYTVAYRVVDNLTVLPGYIMVTLIPEIARLGVKEERTVRIVNQALMSVWLLVMPVAAAMVVAPDVTDAIGGGRYRAAGVVLAILLPAIVMACLNTVLGNVMVAQSRQGALLKVSVANVLINGGVNAALIPRLGAKGAAIALVITEVISLAATVTLYMRGAGRISLEKFGRSVLAGMACAGAMCIRFVIPHAQQHVLLTLVCALAAGGVVYAVAVKALGVIPDPIEALLERVGGRLRPGRGATTGV